jgi:hypothetical protein
MDDRFSPRVPTLLGQAPDPYQDIPRAIGLAPLCDLHKRQGRDRHKARDGADVARGHKSDVQLQRARMLPPVFLRTSRSPTHCDALAKVIRRCGDLRSVVAVDCTICGNPRFSRNLRRIAPKPTCSTPFLRRNSFACLQRRRHHHACSRCQLGVCRQRQQ